MTNEDIIEQLGLMASLMEINDENSFKSDAYRRAVYNLEKLGEDLFGLSHENIVKLEGVGKSIAQSITQLKEKGSFEELDKLLLVTPKGVVEMLSVNGIGPKKIKVLWKELQIESKKDLLEACRTGRVAQQKGFGEKTQKTIEANLLFELSQSGKLRLDQALHVAQEIGQKLRTIFGQVEEAGQLYSKDEIVDELVWVIGVDDVIVAQQQIMGLEDLQKDMKHSSPFLWRGGLKDTDLKLVFHFVPQARVANKRYLVSASEKHLAERVGSGTQTMLDVLKGTPFASEQAIFEQLNLPLIVPELREGTGEWLLAQERQLPVLIEYQDLKGPLHNHSTWSDGKHTLTQMAAYCIEQGWQYLGISDHSQSATYANGLYPERILAQHKEIDALNAGFTGFKIFKGVESDILGDGSLDYEENLLKTFDYIVASVHSGLSMDEEKATARLIKAIENPYTTILGHPTGRLLLKRKGYPVDFQKVIAACAANHVAIEINSSPWRLDISWRYVKYALEQGVKIAICPDAHENEGFLDMHFGIWMGRKGFLTSEHCINCMSTADLEAYFKAKK